MPLIWTDPDRTAPRRLRAVPSPAPDIRPEARLLLDDDGLTLDLTVPQAYGIDDVSRRAG